MDRRFRTDLAAEQRELTPDSGRLRGVRASEESRNGFDVIVVEILDEEGEKALCKPIGKYLTLGLEPLVGRASDAFEDAANLLADLIRELLGPDSGKGTLVAGLGNDEMTPDAVGTPGRELRDRHAPPETRYARGLCWILQRMRC